MIGLSIIRVALPLFFGIEEGETAPARGALTVGIASLATMVAVTVTRAGHVRLYATMIGLLAGYAAAIATGEVDAAFIDQPRDLPWVGLPAAPRFELSVSPLLVVHFLLATVASHLKLCGLATCP